MHPLRSNRERLSCVLWCALQKMGRRYRVAQQLTEDGLTALAANEQEEDLIVTKADAMALASEPLMHSEDEDAPPAAAGEPLERLLTRTCDWRSAQGTRAVLALENRVPIKDRRSICQRGRAFGTLNALQVQKLLSNTTLQWALDPIWLTDQLATSDSTRRSDAPPTQVSMCTERRSALGGERTRVHGLYLCCSPLADLGEARGAGASIIRRGSSSSRLLKSGDSTHRCDWIAGPV